MEMERFYRLDERIISFLTRWSVPALRISLSIVFLWFGLLKVAGASPVADLIKETYSFFPADPFLRILGASEILIGLGLLFRKALRVTLAFLWIQMAGTLFSVFLNPAYFFLGNPLLLTLEGEFLVKNLVLICAGLVIGGFDVPRLNKTAAR
jgi:uncharacterized membrane protein YkgB